MKLQRLYTVSDLPRLYAITTVLLTALTDRLHRRMNLVPIEQTNNLAITLNFMENVVQSALVWLGEMPCLVDYDNCTEHTRRQKTGSDPAL